jgi:hypothetical protein
MNYNSGMLPILLVSLSLCFAPARAEGKAADAGTADAATLRLVDYFLKTPAESADPKLVEPFLAVDAATLPAKKADKTRVKQAELHALLKAFERKKKGSWLTPSSCPLTTFVKPLEQFASYQASRSCRKEDATSSPWCEIDEDQELFLQHQTGCTLEDQGCEFTLLVFVDMAHKKKPRRLILNNVDPLTAIAIQSGGGGQTKFFGAGLTCYHPK